MVSDGEISIDGMNALEDSAEENESVLKVKEWDPSEDKKVKVEDGNKNLTRENKSAASGEDDRDSGRGHEIVYKRGVYLFEDATLRELRNAFVDTEQLDTGKGYHFQFLRSDVAGDKIDIETEDEIMLNQIEHTLTVRRTIFIEMIDSGTESSGYHNAAAINASEFIHS